MSTISTHILDTSRGAPAAAVGVTLLDARGGVIGGGTTDANGRLGDLVEAGDVGVGQYELLFDTAGYFGATPTFYPEVRVRFEITDPASHYHVPLLLSPYGYSTYRGS